MVTWEYQTKESDGPLPDAELNEPGKEGWELVTVFKGAVRDFYYFFKRVGQPKEKPIGPLPVIRGAHRKEN